MEVLKKGIFWKDFYDFYDNFYWGGIEYGEKDWWWILLAVGVNLGGGFCVGGVDVLFGYVFIWLFCVLVVLWIFLVFKAVEKVVWVWVWIVFVIWCELGWCVVGLELWFLVMVSIRRDL